MMTAKISVRKVQRKTKIVQLGRELNSAAWHSTAKLNLPKFLAHIYTYGDPIDTKPLKAYKFNSNYRRQARGPDIPVFHIDNNL